MYNISKCHRSRIQVAKHTLKPHTQIVSLNLPVVASTKIDWCNNLFLYREKKSLHHVAMVAKYLDDSKPKRHLKVDSHCFKLHRSYLISFKL